MNFQKSDFICFQNIGDSFCTFPEKRHKRFLKSETASFYSIGANNNSKLLAECIFLSEVGYRMKLQNCNSQYYKKKLSRILRIVCVSFLEKSKKSHQGFEKI